MATFDHRSVVLLFPKNYQQNRSINDFNVYVSAPRLNRIRLISASIVDEDELKLKWLTCHFDCSSLSDMSSAKH